MDTNLIRQFYPFFLAGAAFEIVWYLAIRRQAYPWAEAATTLGVYAFSLPARLLTSGLTAGVMFAVWSLRPITIPLDKAWSWILLFFCVEFAYYWSHRADHMVRWMWAAHIVHHSPQRMHFLSAFRLSPAQFLSGNWLFYLPLVLIGFHPLAILAMIAFNLAYQFWLHTEIIGKLGFLERFLNTPSHHRVHHASNPDYIDRNFGGVVILWDRLFGTFAEEKPDQAIVYGLKQPIGSRNPLKIIFHEWRALTRDIAKAKSLRSLLRQLFGKPGDSFSARATQPLALPKPAAPASERVSAEPAPAEPIPAHG